MHKPMFMIANLALGGWGGAIDNADLPAEMKIDYIRAYELGDGGTVSNPPPQTGGSQQPQPQPEPQPQPPVSADGVTLTYGQHGDTLSGGAGADTINASQGADRLTGGAGADVFVFKDMPWSAGKITDFQVGVDKLDVTKLYLGGYNGPNPVADGYVRFEADGAGGTKVMLDTDAAGTANPWSFHVVTLTGVNAAGLTAAQVFGSATPPPAAPPPAAPSTPGVALTSSQYADTLTGGAGADTLNAGQGPDKLIGGAGADTFAFKALPWNAGKITDFQVGVDKLDVSQLYLGGYSGSNPVADGYVRFEADGAGGTKVMLDIDAGGAANPWAYTIVTLSGVSPVGLTAAQVFGGSAPTQAPAPAPAPAPVVVPGVSLTSNSYAETLTGGAGADTLNAWNGPDKLVGGAGNDHFVFDSLPWNAGHVADFAPGHDVLDLRALFDAAGYHGTNPIADRYLSFESDGNGGTRVLFDTDGAGTANPWPFHITTLDGVAPSSLSASDWLV
jgi:Ca2+-binding RTX toxin-like protein